MNFRQTLTLWTTLISCWLVFAKCDWTTWGYDSQRTGFNPSESILTSKTAEKLVRVWKLQLSGTTINQCVVALGYPTTANTGSTFARPIATEIKIRQDSQTKLSMPPTVAPTLRLTSNPSFKQTSSPTKATTTFNPTMKPQTVAPTKSPTLNPTFSQTSSTTSSGYNLCYIGNEVGDFYAIDIDRGSIVWKRNLGFTYNPSCGDLPNNDFGIGGTAVFDRSKDTVYAMGGNGTFFALSMKVSVLPLFSTFSLSSYSH